MTRDLGLADADEAALIPMSEAELALAPPSSARVIRHRERFWQRSRPGLYEPIHPLARLTSEQASIPTRRCWAYHTTLATEAAGAANAAEPMHLLTDVESFGPGSISSNRRYQLRRSRRSVEFARVTDVAPLEAHGYEVFRSAQDRTQNPWRGAGSRQAFLDELRWYVERPSGIVLAGFVDGRLGGWIVGFAVGQTAYVELVDIATVALSSHISIGLHFEFVEACRRSGLIREIAHSPHIPEDRALCTFKASIGFPVVHVPSRFVMAPLVEPLVRWRKPFLYYRLSGRVTGPVEAALAEPEADTADEGADAA